MSFIYFIEGGHFQILTLSYEGDRDKLHELSLTALLGRYKIIAFTPNGLPVYFYNHQQMTNFYIFKEWKESTATFENTWHLAVRISIIPLFNIILEYLPS